MAQMVNKDVEHLKLLAVFHFVLGGIVMLLSLFPLLYVLLGVVFMNMPDEQFTTTTAQPAPPGPTIQVQPDGAITIDEGVVPDFDIVIEDDPTTAPPPPVAPAQAPPMGGPPPGFQRTVGMAMVGFGVIACLLGEAIGAMMLFAGYKLNRASNWTFCIVVAGIECLWIPFGTILGVFTIVVLCRRSVKDRFAGRYYEDEFVDDAPPPLAR